MQLFLYILVILLPLSLGIEGARSILRPADPTIPSLHVNYEYEHEQFVLKDSHLEPYPIFHLFDKKNFYHHMLPTDPITYRYEPEKKVDPALLSSFIEELLLEIQAKKKKFKHFTVLAAKNFNKRYGVGMIVFKFNDYPFIVKLYIETPESFINPYCKGLDNIWFFPMSGGINRHLAGLTRIKNLEIIQKKLQESEEWADKTGVPRKWHWLPKCAKWLCLTGNNMGKNKIIKTKIPAIYAVIADAIDGNNNLSLFNHEHTARIMKLTSFLDHWIDSHIDNFMIENSTKKIIIIDTEHFPSVVGLKEKVLFSNYVEWFSYLGFKCARNWFFRTKKERMLAQIMPHGQALC